MKTLTVLWVLILLGPAQAQEEAAVDAVKKEVVYESFALPGVPVLQKRDRRRTVFHFPDLATAVLKARVEDPLTTSLKFDAAQPSHRPTGTRAPTLKLEAAQLARLPTRFSRQLAQWNEPHGETMRTLLNEIRKAEKSGDTTTYNRLAKSYRIWADKYLVRGAKPTNKQTP